MTVNDASLADVDVIGVCCMHDIRILHSDY